jgi:hypothetical protein
MKIKTYLDIVDINKDFCNWGLLKRISSWFLIILKDNNSLEKSRKSCLIILNFGYLRHFLISNAWKST